MAVGVLTCSWYSGDMWTKIFDAREKKSDAVPAALYRIGTWWRTGRTADTCPDFGYVTSKNAVVFQRALRPVIFGGSKWRELVSRWWSGKRGRHPTVLCSGKPHPAESKSKRAKLTLSVE